MSTSNINIEAIYPLSHMQQGMLFHTLLAPQSEVYFDQASWTIQSDLNVEAFRRAWRQVVERHPILRTAFIWERRDKPLQIVRRRVDLPWDVHDWRELSPEDQQEQLEEYVLADRARGFELSEPPLMRFALIRLADEAWHFVWSFHHILLDGWGSLLLLNEVFSFYEAFCDGKQLELSQPRPYRDYIGWLQKQDLSAAEAYWRRRLKGFTSPTPIGTFEKSHQSGKNGYAEEERKIDEQTSRGLEALARYQQVTVNTLIQGAWALLMWRYSGEADVVFGVTVSGRPADLEGVEQMVGLFINTLPVRVQIDNEAQVGPWLKRLQVEQTEMRQYEYSPLVEVQGWSEVERGVPLFESILVFEMGANSSSKNSEPLGSSNVPPIERFQTTNYPLTIRVGVEHNGSIGIVYDAHRFEGKAIRRMAEHLGNILEQMARDPMQRLSQISIITEAERRQLVDDWNDTATDLPSQDCVQHLFEAQVARTPDATALIFQGEKLTYAELNRRANQLARHLRSAGVGPEVLVGIMLQRSFDMVVAILAVLKAGGAYLPLDPEYPTERLVFMLNDSAAHVLLTQKELLELIPEQQINSICIDSDWPAISEHSDENLKQINHAEDLAYIIYTSGTSGTPKGVMIDHGNLTNSLLASLLQYEIAADDVVPCTASFSFDISIFEWLGPLLAGAATHLFRKEDVLDSERFAELLEDATFVHLIAFLMSHFLDYVRERGIEHRYRIRKLFVGGDVVTADLMRKMKEVFPLAQRYIGYGPTEGTIMCTSYKAANDEMVPGDVIGRPLANMNVRLYDKQGQLVPIGVAGEIYLGGRSVARGYSGRPELTAEKFVVIEGERFYRTGDLARYLEDGNLEFIGRADEQVKIRGYRVEMGEVEAALREHNGVNECVVMARADRTGAKQLVAYVVLDSDYLLDSSQLRAHLQKSLPDYMVPASFVILDSLPLTTNGKVDRKALPAPELAGAGGATDYVEPQTMVQEILAATWIAVLKVERVGINDNFFELGGHSLLATQVISRIRESFQLEIPLRAIFEAPTIATLSERIETELKAEHGTGAPPITIVSRDEPLPLSFAQQRLWFLDQLDPNGVAYNMPAVLRLSGPLEVDVFEKSLREIIRRHESLRTRFVLKDGQGRQEICDPYSLEVPVIDLRALSADEREAEVGRLALQEAHEPFDLREVPQIRVKVLRLDEFEHVVFFTMHHIIGDGWSFTVLTRELGILYDAFSRGEASPLPELPFQYADFATWQRGWLQGEALDQQLNYWRKQLADIPDQLELPIDKPRPAVQLFRGATESITLSQELTQKLKALSYRQGSTLYMCLLAIFQTLLYRYSGQTDIVTGTPIANRNRSEIESLIGFFVNALVLRTKVDGDATVKQMIARVREVCLGAYAHQDVPFEQLVEELQPERDLSRQPLFQVMFIMQNLPQDVSVSTGLTIQPVDVESTTAKFDLSFFWAEAESLTGTIEYNTDLFERSTIVRMLGHFENLLQAAVENPDRRLCDLPLLTEGERRELLANSNSEPEEYAADVCLSDLFERIVDLRPNARALTFEDQNITYAELNRRANQLAHHLMRLGIGPDSLCGVLMERSVEMIVGVLGILKAGGAYVPMDPSYPRERLAFMLEDAQLSILLTQESLVELLPELPITKLRLDADWADIAHERDDNPVQLGTPENLAYVIYTSGSTGKPKGVLIQHDNVIRLFRATDDWFHFDENDVWSFFHSYAFDFSVWEIWGALLHGGRLVIVPHWVSRSPDAFHELLRTEQVTVLNQTPSAFRQLIRADEDAPSSDELNLRLVIFGGEALELESLRPWFERHGDSKPQLVNMYGITETTVHVTYRPLSQSDLDQAGKSVIGCPIPDLETYLLDSNLELAPEGVAGEMYVGGDGLARNYLNRPDVTADRFIPHPFSAVPGERLYRTGDLARWIGKDELEYLGRIDQQVKIRGFRIELGEIEAVLRHHPALRDALVVAREDQPGDKRLVSYVVPASRLEDHSDQDPATQWSSDQVSEWQLIFDETYDQPSPQADETFNIIGWNSSYTNQPIAAEEMQAWVDQTVDRILALRPQSVLEIGCGTGLLLFRVAPHCEQYCATDLSTASLRKVQQVLEKSQDDFSHVTLIRKDATDFDGSEIEQFDTVIINSVVQYFPAIDYFLEVLENAVKATRPGGHIFLGDIRSLPLLETFHASVQLSQALDSVSKSELRDRTRRYLSQEEELVIDPAFFHALKQYLPNIGRVEIQLKRGSHQNELTKFRYDVVLHIASEIENSELEWLDWEEQGLTLSALRQNLAARGIEALGLRGVPNARVISDVKLMELIADPDGPNTVAEIRESLRTTATAGEEPDDFRALGDEFQFQVEVCWTAGRTDGSFDVVFRRPDSASRITQTQSDSMLSGRISPPAWQTYASDPLQVKWTRNLVSRLRAFASEKLPDYMVPSNFVIMEAFPLTQNGKVDLKALPGPDGIRPESIDAYVAPRTTAEEILAKIWAEVLRLQRVGVNDNFFELGGDSILSIQTIARAREAGLHLTPKDLFQHQTIARLAIIAKSSATFQAEQGLVTGPLPLTPIQHWFFEQELSEPHHFNQSLLLELRQVVDPAVLADSIRHLVLHHDALRLRFERTESGWQQYHAGAEEPISFTNLDLRTVPEGEQSKAIETVAAETQTQLNLTAGPLLRVVYFDLGEGRPARLLLVCHHLVVDGVSWRILLADLQQAYRSLVAGEVVQLPPKSSSFQQWSQALGEYASSEELAAQVDFWQKAEQLELNSLPVDFENGENLVNSTQTVVVSLGRRETEALLQEVPGVYHTKINEVLLSALGLALKQWSGQNAVLVDLEGHGREEISESVDVSRTVGWFTTIYPVLLDVHGNKDRIGEVLKRVKEQVRAIPGQGIGYGVLRYLGGESEPGRSLRALPHAEVVFNYLGQADGILGDTGVFGVARESSGNQCSQQGSRQHLLNINSLVVGGQLQLSWSFSRNLHRPETIEQLAREFISCLEAIITHCQSEDAGGYTPSDFPLAQLTQDELDQVLGERRQNIDDLYPLSPMQQGMLFHCLYAPDSQLYFNQLSSPISGQIDSENFRRAWQEVIERHSILRTAFRWSGLKQPLQIVPHHVELPWMTHDLRGLAAGEQTRKVEELLLADRVRGFDLSKPPLMRVILIQLGDTEWRVVWSHHHLLMDGWCMPIILKEFSTLYDALQRGETIPPATTRPFRDYIAWLQKQEMTKAEEFWRGMLKGFDSPTSLGHYSLTDEKRIGEAGEKTIKLSPETTDRLESVARQYQLTLNTFVQGAWGLLLSRYSGESDVVFGATVSGRPAALEGIENMLGLFINTLPVRVNVDPQQMTLNWLKALQEQQVEARQYEHAPLMAIQSWSEVKRGSLFESILAFENYPVSGPTASRPRSTNFEMPDVKLFQRTNYPLSLMAWPAGPNLAVQLGYDQRFDEATVDRILHHLEVLLENILTKPDQRLREVSMLTAAERRQLLSEWSAPNSRSFAVDCIHQLFEAQVAKSPNQIALTCGEQQLTYAELNQEANKLAHYLRSLGVGPEVRVALYLERSLDAVISILAVMKSGGAFIPLDPDHPRDRQAFVLADSAASILLTQSSLSDKLPEHSARTVDLDSESGFIALESADNPENLSQSSDLAYLIYTSGTTGKPKAVMIEHGSFSNCLQATQAELDVVATDVIPCVASFSFDISLSECLGALLVGGRTILVRRQEVLDLTRFSEILREVTLMHLVPGMMRQVVNHLKHDPSLPGSRARLVASGGDQVSADLLRDMEQTFPRARRVVLYGPTEGTIIGTAYHVTSEHPVMRPPLGRPLANISVRLYDKQGQLVPVGVIGELYLGGSCLARGYLGRPELTAEKFVVIDGERFYRTGDLARYLEDGNLEFAGRVDQQVKIRGYRVEIEEIEIVLSEHQSIQECVVTARADANGDKQLVAYVVPANGRVATPAESNGQNGHHDIDTSSLKQHLQQYLPEYMVPSVFVALDSLPLTANSKVDRRALPAPNGTRQLARSFVAPRNQTELKLKKIWEEMLDVRPIGITDNFFELGGNSLLTLNLIGQIKNEFEVELKLADVMTDGTIKGLAQLIQENRTENEWSPLVPIKPSGSQLPFYCVHAGGGNVVCFYDLAQQFDEDQPFYGIQATGMVEGQEPLTRIEDMAALYVEAIRKQQPEGPYLIGGYSAGGIIAFEMAQQLQRQGHEVGLVAMLDCFRMTAERDRVKDDAGFISLFVRTMGRILPAEELRKVESSRRVEYALELGREARIIRSFVEEQQLMSTFRLMKAFTQAASNYQPQVYPGTITLFRPSKTTAEVQQNVERFSRITHLTAGVITSLVIVLSSLNFFGIISFGVLAVLFAFLAVSCVVLGMMARKDLVNVPAQDLNGLARWRPLRAVVGGIYNLHAWNEYRKGNFDLGTDFTLGWRDVSAQPVEVVEVPGNHMSIVFKPHVEELAKSLAKSFSRVNNGSAE